MGDRSLIIIRSASMPANTEIRLYGHWAGDSNFLAVKNVVNRTDRIGDPDYLTAQLFHEFSVEFGAYDGNLGYGISIAEQGSSEGWIDSPTVYLNADFGEYEYEGNIYTPEKNIPTPTITCEPEIVYENEMN